MYFLFQRKIIIALLIISFPLTIFAQTTQTKKSQDTSLLAVHNPKKATIMSACVPGLGQIYNKKYWKVPILYAGFAVLGYFIVDNTKQYQDFKNAYLYEYGDSSKITLNKRSRGYVNTYTLDGLQQGKDYYKTYRDLSIILIGFVYVLNIIDATVDANLFNFNVTEDVSLQLKPVFGNYTGLGLSLRFGNKKLN